jgi:hypothetical protein
MGIGMQDYNELGRFEFFTAVTIMMVFFWVLAAKLKRTSSLQ